jgi:prepilin-type N-terminal cleavage/methylation domain-containing protein
MKSATKLPRHAGVTLPEVLIAVLILSAFFASVFELNAVCLRYIDATKESVAALQAVHDRCEVMRNLAFSDLTNSSYLNTLMASAPNGSDFSRKATEVVQLRAYPVANGITQFTRHPDGSVTQDSTATDLGQTLVQVDVSSSWNMTFGARARSEQTTSIISNGQKK